MKLRLKTNQTETECNAYRCKKYPKGEVKGVGYLCADHADKVEKSLDKGLFVELLGQKPLFGGGPREGVVFDEEVEDRKGVFFAEGELPAKVELKSDHEADLQKEAKDLEEAKALILAFELATEEDLAFAKSELDGVQAQWKSWEEKRTEITGPINIALKATNAMFKPVQKTLKDIEGLWKSKILAEKKAREQERVRLLEEARESEDVGDKHTALIAASEAKLEAPGMVFTDRWVFEIVGPTRIPREFLVPSERLIGAHVKEHKEKAKIPGVAIWKEESLTNRKA